MFEFTANFALMTAEILYFEKWLSERSLRRTEAFLETLALTQRDLAVWAKATENLLPARELCDRIVAENLRSGASWLGLAREPFDTSPSA